MFSKLLRKVLQKILNYLNFKVKFLYPKKFEIVKFDRTVSCYSQNSHMM